MATGKLAILTTSMDPESWELFMANKPNGWQVKVVNPDDGEEKVAKELEDTQYLVTTLSGPVSSKVLETAKQLKLIQHAGQGCEHLPMKWILEKGIPVACVGGANALGVAEHTVLLMLACLRRLLPLNQSILEGKFRGNFEWKTHELYDRTVGIVGFGNIGRRVAKLCYAFGANIIYFDEIFIPDAVRADFKARLVSLDELLSTSDIVTLHVPLLESTRGMLGWAQLNKMKPSAYIINTSRGGIIDQDALIRALNEKRIAGAGLDVLEQEPPDPKSPLLQMANVVVTPHMAGLAWETREANLKTVWSNVLRVSERKEALHRVRE